MDTPNTTVTIRHPKLADQTVEVPTPSLPHYAAAGWQVVPDTVPPDPPATPAPPTQTPAAPETAPKAEAAPASRPPRSRRRTVTEEGAC